MDVATVLNAAADLLEKPGAWTQGFFALNAYGVATMAHAEEAVCWCAIGSIQKAAGTTTSAPTIEARRAVEGVIGEDVAAWNDDGARTQAEVVAALRQAALSHRPKDATDD